MNKVLVCGGRDFLNRKGLFGVLNQIHYSSPINLIIHGGALGADQMAGSWARKNKIAVKIFPAQWQKYGKSAGYQRNAQMLKEGLPDFVVAFPGGKGTKMMVELAYKAGLIVYEN